MTLQHPLQPPSHWIGMLHLLIPIFTIIYILVAPLKYDKVMFVYLVILALHWVILKGECLISYVYKVTKNPNYHLGDNTRLEDMYDFMHHVHQTTHIPLPFLTALINLLNFLALYLLLARMLVYKSVQPKSIVVAYIVFISIYFMVIRMS